VLARSLPSLCTSHREDKQLCCSAFDLVTCGGRRQSKERGAHTHGPELAEEWAPAASVVVGCSTPVFVIHQGSRMLAMDPAEEGARVDEKERRGDGGGGGGGVGGASRRCSW
jgi:hypothetical protein